VVAVVRRDEVVNRRRSQIDDCADAAGKPGRHDARA
jgi:hypothetical protein